MAPIKVKQSPSTTAQTLTGTTSSQDARLLVRETLRISANLASSSSNAVASVPPVSQGESVSLVDARRFGLVEEDFVDSSLRLICCEEIDGLRWKYVAENDGFGRLKKNSIRSVSLNTRQVPVEELMSFIRSYVVPEGFPDSVTPSYVPYMTWRALKV
uniref:Uncharacterized protein MANES_07G030900 n=1 Tax=Rhizophora mucronata TaxID=61149 RepID=A0A2P2LVI0_RHIMU